MQITAMERTKQNGLVFYWFEAPLIFVEYSSKKLLNSHAPIIYYSSNDHSIVNFVYSVTNQLSGRINYQKNSYQLSGVENP